MADLLVHANAALLRLYGEQLAGIRAWYRGAVVKGITDNQGKYGKIARAG